MPSQAGSIQSSTRSGAAPIIAMLLALALALTVTVLVLAATSVEYVTADGMATAPAEPSLSITDVSALEGNSSRSNVMFTVTLSTASDQQVTVGYASANGTATWPSDYFRIRPATLNFPPGRITQTITAEIKGDTLYESDETFFVNLFNATNATLADDQAAGTLLNDDAEPTVQFSAIAYTVNEGVGSATITTTLTGATAVTATVSYTTSNGTALDGTDYTATGGTLVFAPGMTSQTFSVPIISDTLLEGNESLVLTLSNATGTTLGSPNAATLTIVDYDAPPTVQFSAPMYNVNESAGSATITATLTGATAVTATVRYATSNGTALAGSDYTATSGTLTFAPGTTTRTFNVAIIGDVLDEADETIMLTLSNPVNATLGTPNPATLIIVDDEGVPAVRFHASAYTVDENAGPATIVATLSHESAFTVTVRVATQNGSARSTTDYAPVSRILSFAPQTTAMAFSVPITDDIFFEGNETLILTLSNPLNATLGSPNPVALTIVDNEAPPTVQFSAAAYGVAENAGPAMMTVTLSTPSAFTATVNLATSNSTASSADDYTAVTSRLTFVPGATRVSFTVPITDDVLEEPDESVTLALSVPNNATLGTPHSATLTILDNDHRLRLYLPLMARAYAGGPNLVPLSLKVSPAAPIVSQTTTFAVVIQNQGTTVITTPFWVDLYIDPVKPPTAANETWDTLCPAPPTPCYGGAWLITRTLAPGQVITLTSAALHPDFDYWPDRFVTSGSHAVYVYVDSWEPNSLPSGYIEETNESDNRADLTVQVAPALMQNQAEAQDQLTTPLTPGRLLPTWHKLILTYPIQYSNFLTLD